MSADIGQRIALLAMVGAVAGSFIGLVSLRLPHGVAIINDRSRCASCGTQLAPRDLVPLLSFVAMRGSCRHCGAAIPLRYPAIEAAAVLIGVVAAALFALTAAIAAALLGWWLLLLAILDAEHRWLPDVLTLPLVAAGLAATAWLAPGQLPAHAIGAAAGFTSLWLVATGFRWLRGRDGLGGGDAKLFAASGAWLGWEALPTTLFVAAATGLVAALWLHRRRRLSATTELPFGVFLAVATWLAYLAPTFMP
jgi:leader peptidase (prepilin peptidase)/N-methyltransferase